jgi:hypothetical protein
LNLAIRQKFTDRQTLSRPDLFQDPALERAQSQPRRLRLRIEGFIHATHTNVVKTRNQYSSPKFTTIIAKWMLHAATAFAEEWPS